MTDIVDSSGLVARLAERYAPLLADSRRLIRAAVRKAGGHEVDARADEFSRSSPPSPAIRRRSRSQRGIGAHPWPDDGRITLRAGLHAGRPTLTEGRLRRGCGAHHANRIASVVGRRRDRHVACRSRLLGDEVIGGDVRRAGRASAPRIPSPESAVRNHRRRDGGGRRREGLNRPDSNAPSRARIGWVPCEGGGSCINARRSVRMQVVGHRTHVVSDK